MTVHADRIELDTEGFSQVIDISRQVQEIVERSGIGLGLCLVSVPGSTASVTTIEYEEGVRRDLVEALERLAPSRVPYHHDARWGDGNGFSHVRASLMVPSVTVPVSQGRLELGTWQQMVLVDHDNRSRHRQLVVRVVGE